MNKTLKIVSETDYLALRGDAKVLEADSHGEKVMVLVDGTILKLFRRKRLLSSALWYPYAQRFVDNAVVLQRYGIPVPEVVAAMRIPSIERDAVHYRPLVGTTLRALDRGGLDVQAGKALKDRFTRFIIHLHDLGIYFRSLHLGNVIVTPGGELGLIDFSDLRAYRRPLSRLMRRRNIRRMLSMEGERDWIDSVAILDPGIVRQTPKR